MAEAHMRKWMAKKAAKLALKFRPDLIYADEDTQSRIMAYWRRNGLLWLNRMAIKAASKRAHSMESVNYRQEFLP